MFKNNPVCWEDADGCSHFCDVTSVIEQKWKAVPLTNEESAAIENMMLKIATAISSESIYQFESNKKSTPKTKECVEVS